MKEATHETPKPGLAIEILVDTDPFTVDSVLL
jgi:hypothetical protein